MAEGNEKPLLDGIDSPEDLRRLGIHDKERLAGEIRAELLEVISRNGGHLAPNLGVVELTIALHSVFSMPDDKIIWDVGHQGYVHKLLTGRRRFFKTLRQDGGCGGFLSREESKFDVFGAGHAGTAVSAALGFAVARDRKGAKNKVVAVVGDGSLSCGVTLEALNHVSETTKDFIIVVNDNKMSISRNVGAMAQHLNRIITGKGYNKFKTALRNCIISIPRIGERLTKIIARIEEATKSIIVPGVIFEELGMRYFGPVDGHDIRELEKVFNLVREADLRPAIVHVYTEKGRGYSPAEAAPEKFHGLSSFDPDTGLMNGSSEAATFSSVFGKAALDLASRHSDVVAVAAAMAYATGLSEFAKKFPDRFFDVGIAEEHAVVFAAGMAAEGYRPIVAIYSTFLQRALDYIFHDVCLQNLPVIFCCDRAGVVEDGPTHHGIHDLGFLRSMPNLSILSPKDGCELRRMLAAAYSHAGPVVIRYPKAVCSDYAPDPVSPGVEWGRAERIGGGDDLSIWSLGHEFETAVKVAEILRRDGISAGIVNTRFIRPFDEALLREAAAKMPVATIENSQMKGGLASCVDEILVSAPHRQIMHFGWGDGIIPHGTVAGIRRRFRLTPEDIAEAIKAGLSRG